MLPLLTDPWFLVPVDSISAMRSTVHRGKLTDAAITQMLRRTRSGYHRLLAALAGAGNDVIADYPLSEPWRLRDLLGILDGYDVTLVDVQCSPAELQRRERERSDRPGGLALSQQVFAHQDRDILIDSTDHSAESCATLIVDELRNLKAPKACDRLRRRLIDTC